MSKVYVGQVGVRISLDTGADLTGATTTEIKYKDPAGVEGTWDAIVDGTSIYYDVLLDTILALSGDWYVQAHIAGVDFDLLGETAKFDIHRAWR